MRAVINAIIIIIIIACRQVGRLALSLVAGCSSSRPLNSSSSSSSSNRRLIAGYTDAAATGA